MKTKWIAIGMGLALMGVALWFGRVAWRAHRNLVTLHVQNASLAEVLRKIERQTWEKIQLNPLVDARVKLDVKDMPLEEVLAQLAEQSGAHSTIVYAVYHSKPALRRLESALQGRTSLESAGWTNVSKPMPFAMGMSKFPAFGGPPFPNSSPGSFHNPPGVLFQGAEAEECIREHLKAQGLDGKVDVELMGRKMKEAMERGTSRSQADGLSRERKGIVVGPTVAKVFRHNKDGSTESFGEDPFSPTRLVVESRLSSRLADLLPLSATPEVAAKAARKTQGRWTTLYALEKSPFGLRLSGFGPGMGKQAFVRFNPAKDQIMSLGTNSPPPVFRGEPTNSLNSLQSNLEQTARRRKVEDFSKFTPEQRVQRAREHRSFSSKPSQP